MKNKNKALLVAGITGTAITVGGAYAYVNKLSKDLKGLDIDLNLCDGKHCMICSDYKNCDIKK